MTIINKSTRNHEVSWVLAHVVLVDHSTLGYRLSEEVSWNCVLIGNLVSRRIQFLWYNAPGITYSHLSNKRGGTFIDFEKKIHPPRTFPPSTIIDFLDFFHPPLHVYYIYVLVFPKDPTLHVYSNLHVYWFCKFCTPSTFIPTSTVIREMRVGPMILAKIKIYVFTRAKLLFQVCYETPCNSLNLYKRFCWKIQQKCCLKCCHL